MTPERLAELKKRAGGLVAMYPDRTFGRVIAELVAEVERLWCELEGERKARNLTTAGLESVTELGDGLKHENRRLREEVAHLKARNIDLHADLAGYGDADVLRDEVNRLRAKNTELHRRCQAAEAALADLVRCNEKLASGAAWCGGSLGRAFLAYANSQLRERVAELERLNAGLLDRVAELEAGLKPFAEYGRTVPEDVADGLCPSPYAWYPAIGDPRLPTVGHCRRAAAVLAKGVCS